MPVLTRKSCFVHVHKTGGTWARMAMVAAGLEPMIPVTPDRAMLPATHYTPAMSPSQWLDGRYVFTFVRDPYMWLRSWFCSREKEQWTNMQGPSQSLHVLRHQTFDGFLRNYLDRMPGAVGRVFAEYTDGCDFVGRVEDQPDALVTALDAAGEDFDEEIVRAYPRQNEAIPSIMAACINVDPGLVRAVYDADAEHCWMYGYEYDADASGVAA